MPFPIFLRRLRLRRYKLVFSDVSRDIVLKYCFENSFLVWLFAVIVITPFSVYRIEIHADIENAKLHYRQKQYRPIEYPCAVLFDYPRDSDGAHILVLRGRRHTDTRGKVVRQAHTRAYVQSRFGDVDDNRVPAA